MVLELRRKRAEVAVEIREVEQLLGELRADLDALDGSLAIFNPDRMFKALRR